MGSILLDKYDLNLSDLIKTLDISKADEFTKLFRYQLNGTDNKKRFTSANGERIGSYENSGLYSIFLNLAQEVYEFPAIKMDCNLRLDYLIKRFNAEFKNCASRYVFDSSEILQLKNNLFDNLYLSPEDKIVGRKIVEEFNEAFKRVVVREDNSEEKYFRYNDVIKYLDAYIELCRFVFEDDRQNQAELRSHRIIERILNVYYNSNQKCFGLYSPFVIFSLLRTLKCIASLPDEIDNSPLTKECAKQLNTRRHIVSTYAIRSFSRFTIFKGKSYVVEYSRRNDRIICKKADEVSSVDNTKPIRLFEKITSHIYNYFSQSNSENEKDFNISIYGFCSYKREKGKINPLEIDDLIYEIFSWLEDKKESEDRVLINKFIRNISIQYYLIKKDTVENSGYSTESSEENHDFLYVYKSKDLNYGLCELSIKENNYDVYNNNHLQKVINESDIIFLLDCPWLATEDFNLASEGDLETYGQWIKSTSYERDLDFSCQKQKFFNKEHLFDSVNNQFNRMSVNNMVRYGKVVRVMKDYLIKWIQSQIEEYKLQNIYKTVYIYNSSLRGMAYSDFADYPIIREESYSNKKFGIMRFSTRDNSSIKIGKEKNIFISLWSLVKYVDISFAYLGIKEFFNRMLYKFIQEGKTEEEKEKIVNRDIISILRNIVFVVDYSDAKNNNTHTIRIKIALSKPVRKIFDKANDDKDYLNEINEIISFFETIISNIIFKNSNGFGDDCIRDAFERCLYNQAKTVEDLFFLHMYSSYRQNESLALYDVQIDSKSLGTPDFEVDDLVPNFDSFGDKRAYNKLFSYLDMPRYPEYAVNSILNQTNRIFGDDYNFYSKTILKNMLNICIDFDYKNSFLYRNLTYILK